MNYINHGILAIVLFCFNSLQACFIEIGAIINEDNSEYKAEIFSFKEGKKISKIIDLKAHSIYEFLTLEERYEHLLFKGESKMYNIGYSENFGPSYFLNAAGVAFYQKESDPDELGHYAYKLKSEFRIGLRVVSIMGTSLFIQAVKLDDHSMDIPDSSQDSIFNESGCYKFRTDLTIKEQKISYNLIPIPN